MVDKDDEALERMRAADPAIGSHPDLVSLRHRLSRTTPLGHTGGVEDDRAVRIDGAGTRGSRTSIVAAAAVVAIGLGAGGYAVGAQTAAPDGGGTPVAGQPDRATDRAADVPEREAAGDSGGGLDGAPMMSEGDGETAIGGDSASSMAAMLPVVLSPGAGLSTSGGTGEVKAVRGADIDEVAFLRAWGQTLGLDGEPTGDDDYFSLTNGMVTISIYGGTYPSFDYMDTSLDPYCAEALVSGDTARATAEPDGGDVDILPAPGDCEEPSGAELTEDEALATAREFLDEAGVGAEGYELSVEQWDTGGEVAAYYVNGAIKDSDLPQQQWVSVTVTPEGVAMANGQLEADLVSMGEYPLVSPVEAVERVGDPRFTTWGTVYVPSLDEGHVDLYEQEWVEPDWPDVDLSAGAAIPFWMTEGTVVEARVEQGVLSVPSGHEFVVPTYVLTDDQGRNHTMIALADEALDFTP